MPKFAVKIKSEMMSVKIISKCGYRCDLCLAFKENIVKNDRRAELSDGWYKCFGFRMKPDEIYCEGCNTPGKPKLIDLNCSVRPCVIEKGLQNCSECDQYPCENFRQREVVYENVIKDKEGITLSDRELFIKPYENKTRLENLRNKKAKE